MEVEDEERSETLSQVSSNASTEPLSPEALERQRSQQLSTSARPRETSAEGESRTRGGSLTSDLSNLSDMDMDDFEPETSRPEDNQPTFQEELHILEQDELQRNTAATPPSVESAQGTIGHGPPAELAHSGTDLYHPAEAEGYGQQNKTAESEAPEVSTEAEGDQPEDNVLQRIQAEESAQMHQEQDYDEEEDEEEVMQPTELEQPQGPEAYDPEEPEEAEPDIADQNRANAIESLLKLEVDFAKLRDALFLERMAEVTSERQLIQDDAHPDLTYLYDHLTHKRKTRLDVAKRWLVRLQQEADLEKLARERIAWSQWTEQRATLKSGLLDEVNGKRRALEREKRVSDRGNRDERLIAIQNEHHERKIYQSQITEASIERNLIFSEQDLANAFRRQTIHRESDYGMLGLPQEAIALDLNEMANQFVAPRPGMHPGWTMGMPPGSLPPQTNGYGPYPPQQQHFSSSNHMPHTDPTPQPGGSSPMPSNSNLAESSAGTPTTVPVPTPVALSEPIPSTSINASLSVLPSSSSAPEVSLAPASTAASPVQPLPTFAPVASSSVAEAGLVSTQEPSESLRESIPASSEPATPADAGDNKTEEPFISSLPPVAQPISSSTTTHAAHPPHSAPPQASTAPPLAMATAGAS